MFTLAFKSYLQHLTLSNFSNNFVKNLLIDGPISTFLRSIKGKTF